MTDALRVGRISALLWFQHGSAAYSRSLGRDICVAASWLRDLSSTVVLCVVASIGGGPIIKLLRCVRSEFSEENEVLEYVDRAASALAKTW